MSFLRRRRHSELDARVADATRRAEAAREEAQLSQARHEAIVETIVTPLRQAAEQNRFAELLRRSLAGGYRGHA